MSERKHAPPGQGADQPNTRVSGFQDSIPQMAWTIRTDGSIAYVNRRWKEYTGRSSGEMADWTWTEVIHPDDKHVFMEKWQAAMRSGEHFNVELRIRRSDGVYRWHSLKNWPTREQDGIISRWFGTATDIDEQRQLTDKLQQSNIELSQFASIVAHDLQEPLRMVGAFISLLQRKYGTQLDEHARGYITQAIEANKRMLLLVSELLELSRIGHEAAPISKVDASEVLAEVETILKKSIDDPGCEIAHGKLPLVPINRAHLASLLQNLIGNGLKYHRPDVPPKIAVDAELNGQEWVFTVRDNGIGIAPADYTRIFEAFTRLHTREEFSGTGIGLAICKKIVDFYKGCIWVEPSAGDGSTFKFSIPDVSPSDQPREMQSEKSQFSYS